MRMIAVGIGELIKSSGSDGGAGSVTAAIENQTMLGVCVYVHMYIVQWNIYSTYTIYICTVYNIHTYMYYIRIRKYCV